MALIPIVIKPYPDELLCSWVMRLAKVNGLQIYNFINAYFGDVKYTNKGSVPVDIGKNFSNFCDALGLNIENDALYLKLSTFSYECIGLSETTQTRYLNNVFYPIDKINTKTNSFFTALNVCPECIREDINCYKEPYFHRAHQLSGIYKCYKHNTLLRKYIGKSANIDNFNLDEYKELEGKDKDYSRFAYKLQCANLDINLDKVISLCNKNNLEAPKGGIYGSSTGLILPNLYSLCNGDISVLKGLLEGDSSTSVIKKFYCDDCDKEYFGTSYGYGIGWRCPLCAKRQNVQTRFKSMVSFVGETEYEVISEYKSMDKRVLFKHSCGLENKIRPRGFLYEGIRCRCQKEILLKEAKEKIESSGKFKLLEYTKTESPMAVESLECGHTFKVAYRAFLESERCRVCYPQALNDFAFSKKIDDLTNGEFKFVGKYKDYKTRANFLHTKCNKTFETTPADFLERFYCPYCDSVFNDRWGQNYKLLCEYKNKYKNSDVPKLTLYKDSSLGIWCQRQRNKYKEGILSKDRIEKLNAIGFSFNPLEDEWERKYKQYEKYIKENKSSEIHKRTMFEGEKLGVWIFIQKKVYKEGKMSDYRADKLLQLNKDIFD